MRRSRASRIASTISLAPTEPNSLPSVARPLVDRQHGLGEQRGRLLFALGPRLLGLFGGRLASLRLLQRTGRGRRGQLAGDEVVAQVAGRDVDRFAALPEALDVLEEDGLRHQRSPT